MKDSDCSRSDLPQVLLARPVFTTPWCRLIEKTGRGFDAPYYVLHTSDYVTVLAITDDDRLVLVRQWRPALEAFSLERLETLSKREIGARLTEFKKMISL